MKELQEILDTIQHEESRKIAEKLLNEANKLIEAGGKSINSLETKNYEILKEKKEAIALLKKASGDFGFDIQNYDASAQEVLDSHKKTRTEKETMLSKEIEQLKGKLSESFVEQENLQKTHKSELMNLRLERDATTLLNKYNANTQAHDYILNDIKKIADFDDKNGIIFKNEDGTTRLTGARNANLEDIIQDMRNTEEKNGEFFKFKAGLEKTGGLSSTASSNGVVAVEDIPAPVSY